MTPIRMGMGLEGSEQLANEVMHRDGDPRLREAYTEQLWLWSVFVEQRRRTNRADREAFDRRADRILALLDPT